MNSPKTNTLAPAGASDKLIAASPAELSREAMAYAGLTLTSCAWASAFIAGKIALVGFSPLMAAACRYLLAAAVLLPFAYRHMPPLATLRRVWRPLAVMMICGGLLYQWLVMASLGRTSATNSSLLIALNPALTMLLSVLTGEPFERRRLGGILLALAGAALVITHGEWEHLRELAMLSLRSGDLLALAAALCWACFNVASRHVVVDLKSSFVNCSIYGFGGIILGTLGLTQGGWGEMVAAAPSAWGGIVVMAIGSSVLAGQLFLHGVRVVGVTRTVVFVYLTPVLTALSAALLLGEQLYLMQAVGGAAVLAGVYSATRRR